MALHNNWTSIYSRLKQPETIPIFRCLSHTYIQWPVQYNMLPELEKAKQDLNRWSVLPISLAGRINSVKMTILPRFLFLFQTVPVFIPKVFFQEPR